MCQQELARAEDARSQAYGKYVQDIRGLLAAKDPKFKKNMMAKQLFRVQKVIKWMARRFAVHRAHCCPYPIHRCSASGPWDFFIGRALLQEEA